MNSPAHKKRYKIHGMHCASCEVTIERKLKAIPGVEHVNVNHAQGHAEVSAHTDIELHKLQDAISEDGYTVSHWEENLSDAVTATAAVSQSNTRQDYIQIGAAFLIIASAYLILKQFNIVPDLGISSGMSYGFIVLIGVVAALSTCLAVTGGLLLAVAAKHNAQNPDLTGMQKFKPHLYFNLGRILSYTILGGAVGAVGSLFTLSPKTNGILVLIASFVMILLGLQLLNLFPSLRAFQPHMPKALAHKIHDLTDSNRKGTPMVLGASTFFLPCGFTQALQLYVLSEGDMITGALTMLAFSLGTLPALLSLGVFSSFAKGTVQKYFLKFAGVLVVLVGFFSINNGLTLTGVNIGLASDIDSPTPSSGENIIIEDGKQIIEMTVDGLQYKPNRFTVYEGIPVEWKIDGSRAQGCGQVLIMPGADVVQYLNPDKITVINFTPQKTGNLSFNCSMGMMTPNSEFTVVPNTTGITPSASSPIQETEWSECDPAIANCDASPSGPVQKFTMNVTAEQGFYPNEFTVKKGLPVELEINAQVPLGGCMSTAVIPEYNVAQIIPQGKSTLTFTPTEEGIVPLTCAMGIEMGRFIVIE